ncbi:MAG: endo alpha-1,4 polygalactosaminidase [Alicyclobacillus sp.]|nr:endo alpha-1,4 polygalactosaminidase [Alicyclobacillus sp.]
MKRVQRYMVYYGTAKQMPEGRMDLAIVEPTAHDARGLRALQARGTLVLAYVSVMEAGPHQAWWSGLPEAAFLHGPDGERVERAEYGNFVMDLCAPAWRGMVAQEVGRRIAADGYDGVFLDTIGDVEMVGLPDAVRQFEAAVDLVGQLRQWFPDAVLVQNNGLERLVARTAPHIDGVVWENPPLLVRESSAWVAAVRDRLRGLQTQHDLQVFVLFDGVEAMRRDEWVVAQSFCDANRFIPSFSPRHYLGSPIGEVER